MVLIDWTNNSLKTLIDGCTKLKELSLLLYDNAWGMLFAKKTKFYINIYIYTFI